MPPKLRRRSKTKKYHHHTNDNNNDNDGDIYISKDTLLILLSITIILNIWISAFNAAARGGTNNSAARKREVVIEPYHGPLPSMEHMDTPVIVFTCNRDEYLSRTLKAILMHHPMTKFQQQQPFKNVGGEEDEDTDNSAAQTHSAPNIMAGAPIIISQDGYNPKVTSAVQEYTSKFANLGIPLYHLQHTPRTVTNEYDSMGYAVRGENGNLRGEEAYKSLAVHFGWGLHQVFSGEVYKDKEFKKHLNSEEQYDKEDTMEKKRQLYYGATPPNPARVIVLEEDIEISPDFFSYMNATAYLLDEDSTLFAVSAFNDNSLEGKISDRKRLLRSDFFGGLGWMMNREVWENGIGSNWPDGYWDEWLRDPEQRRGRHIIRPEVSRTYHFGVKDGASGYWDGKLISQIVFNREDVKWENMDLSYLKEETYRRDYWKMVSASKLVDDAPMAKKEIMNGNIRVEYKSLDEFRRKAKFFGIMKDSRAGVPRTAYRGVVEFRKQGQNVVFLTPPFDEMEKDFTNSS